MDKFTGDLKTMHHIQRPDPLIFGQKSSKLRIKKANKIAIYHPTQQPICRENTCKGNAVCLNICLLIPPSVLPEYRCMCPIGDREIRGT